MLVDEARLASAIDHANVVKVRELGFDRGEPFIVMDYVEGASLAELRKELAGGRPRRRRPRRGAHHRSTRSPASTRAHELRDDNGAPLGHHPPRRQPSQRPHRLRRARATSPTSASPRPRTASKSTRTHEVKGKLAYLAPERIDKRRICTVQSDVFSMAVVLWECFAGRRLFRGEEAVDTLQDVMSAPIPPLRKLGANIPPELDDVIMRGLSRDLDTRYVTAKDFAQAIERAAGPANVGSHEDVARVMEAVFGARMQARHVKIRAAIGSRRHRPTPLPVRACPRAGWTAPEATVADAAILAAIAPPAPSGTILVCPEREPGPHAPAEAPVGRPWQRHGRAVDRRGGRLRGHSRTKRPVVVPTPNPPPTLSPPEPTARKVVVPLPFLATHVTFDDESRDLDPAVDVAAFEVPREGGARHRVTATAIDGSKASGFVREQDGVARVEPDGFAIELPASAPGPLPHSAGHPSTAPPGTVKNGFTKLR